ncbi:hypothetical protein [Halobacillus naozhouensis]|uniref:Lipoprotein n=1 Tax=Halobacillus naozhouensis TaxID=554880 RepID=A0ABY8IZS7_9BACI|nr:hypothetical protein [Halobacillus naozhouensis]WFT74709.1 hypothetical protein P9989_20585 [Halobacillus naozhouensis]
MKKLTLLFLCLATLIACSNDADSEESYSVDDARKDGHVIEEHLVDNFEQITQGALKVQNVDKIPSFLESVDQKESDSVNISIFTKDGTHFKTQFPMMEKPFFSKITSEDTTKHRLESFPVNLFLNVVRSYI